MQSLRFCSKIDKSDSLSLTMSAFPSFSPCLNIKYFVLDRYNVYNYTKELAKKIKANLIYTELFYTPNYRDTHLMSPF